MCKKLIYLISFVSVLGLVLTRTADAADPGLVGYWTFDEGTISGTVVADSSGKGNHGISVGGPTPVLGKVGTGALALGPGIWIAIDSVADDLADADNIAVNAWVRTASDASTGSNVYWFSAHTSARSNIFMFGIAASNAQGRANIYDGGVGGASVTSKDPVNDNRWHMLTYTKSGSVGALYVDGVEQGTHTPEFPPFSPESLWSIGQEWDSGGPSQFFHDDGKVDEVAIWKRALTGAEIVKIYNAGNGMPLLRRPAASDPNPADASTDVPRDVVLGWNPGEFANTHDVYLGTSFGDVNDARRTNPLDVLVIQDQQAVTYAPPGLLEFGQTYYWRIDEVNAAPDSTVFKGTVWSFTVEPFSIPITHITATASSTFGISGPEKTIDGSGLVDDLHGVFAADMWISSGVPATIEYAFDRAYKLHELWIWNSNQLVETFVGFGAKEVVIEHSLDGENWTVLQGVGPLAQAPGAEGYAHNSTIDFGGAMAQHVRVSVNGVQGIAPQASLSEVRFYYIPTFATRPNPASGATNVSPDVTLAWGQDGREAGSHDVYLGTDSANLSLAGNVSESSFDTLAVDLQLSQTYYWRVDEVNDVMEPSTWTGDVWSFTTADVIIIDDMESYKDEEFFEIWATWIDGFDDPANGALVGANPGTGDFSPESTIVHGGNKSLPIHYDNSAAAQSEATRSLAVSQDWTRAGVTTLVVWFHGAAGNTGQMYLKVNGTKIPYDGPAGNIALAGWQVWNIDLASLGMNLQSVRSLAVGVEG
ncbi:MAG: hypothetical protein E2O78_04545, partial [Caldithrix sp.]